MKSRRFWPIFLAAFLTQVSLAHAADDDFAIGRFDVQGNTLLSQAEVNALVAPFVGQHRSYGDVQKALEALENAYRTKGYGAVQVYVPEQELTAGVVTLKVTETVIGTVTVTGNRHFPTENVLRSLPLLKPGTSPNLRQISENVQLSNENPSKQEEVTLSVGDEDGKVNANVQVDDDNPKKVILTLDNTGLKNMTGQYRAGVAYRDANLAGSDEVLTLGYIMAPDAPGGVDVEVYSLGFRKPFYDIGDSLDVVYGYSSVNIPSNVIAPGGALAMNGKGDVLALRWNHLFPRQGEYSSRLVFGYDQKNQLNPCRAANGTPFIGANCVATFETVLSSTYAGQWQTAGLSADYSLGLFHNMGWGAAQEGWRYVYAAGNRAAPRDFTYLQGGGNLSFLFSWGGMFHAGLASQFSNTPLPASEQLSLAGYSAVRGFSERAITADSGYVLNLELYSQDLAPWMSLPWGTLKALTFVDMAAGFNHLTPNSTYINDLGVVANAVTTTMNERVNLASMGVGLRYALNKAVTARFDWARVMHSAPAMRGSSGLIDSDWRAHFGLTYTF